MASPTSWRRLDGEECALGGAEAHDEGGTSPAVWPIACRGVWYGPLLAVPIFGMVVPLPTVRDDAAAVTAMPPATITPGLGPLA